MARGSDLDPDLVDEIVSLLRFYHSPECRSGGQISSTALKIQQYRLDHPYDFARALRAYNARFAGRKERRGLR